MQPLPKAPTKEAPVVRKTVVKLSELSKNKQDQTTLSNDFITTAPISRACLPKMKMLISAVAIKTIANMKILIRPPISFLSMNFEETMENGSSKQ
jgi:hypothetical protein